jgi:lipoyl(octanoyl) transferase
MSELWLFLQSPAADAATNMAVDEALLRNATERRMPLLRVYTWVRPAVSFGYFQKFPARVAAKYEIIRRPTGGGMVYHGDDTTYAVVVPPGHPLYEMKTADAYCAIHKAVAAACEQSTDKRSGRSPTIQTAPPTSPRGQYECFRNPVHGDVISDGRKLAGGAQRRTKHGMLHQGSIAAKVTADQLEAGFRRTFQADFQPYVLTPAENVLAGKLAREKYATDTWNRKVRR